MECFRLGIVNYLKKDSEIVILNKYYDFAIVFQKGTEL